MRLSDLIGDLLFLARAESPLSNLRRERVDVGELLGGVREYYEASAADGGVSLTTARDRRDSIIAEARPYTLARAVGNLMSNACPAAHAAASGAVVLAMGVDSFRRELFGPKNILSLGSSSIRIEVSDTGVSIPAESLPRVVFDRFFRVDSSRAQASGECRSWGSRLAAEHHVASQR